MSNSSLQSILGILAAGTFVAWAGSQGSAVAFGIPVFALCGLVSFGLNWLVFVPAYWFQSERFFDATGSLTYLLLLSVALSLSSSADARAFLLACLVATWALRLGFFLFRRIAEDGGDGRFDHLKPEALRFLMVWTLQGLWVYLTVACALAAISATARVPLGWPAAVGCLLWSIGFSLEVIADRQKRAFRADPAMQGRFITSGLWAWSRHPNYFGEITLWFGVALVAAPALSGAQLFTLVSPVFVFVLLTRISGIPLLEARGKRRWGDDPEYQAYKARTPVLIPRRPRSVA